MSKKFAFLFPGQGAQYPGMGKDFYDQFPIARQTFEEADEFLSRPFSKLVFEGPSDELTLTKNSQIAIYIASIAALRVVQQQFPDLKPSVCAGLSLGEYTALTAAGKIAFTDCLDLVRTRAEAMHMACEETKGSMQVVLGMAEEAVETVIRALNPPHPVWVANLNCPGQVVIAGSVEALVIAGAALKEKGAKRVLPLEVSGAFHSGLMRSAQEKLAAKIATVPFQESPIEIVMNVPGDIVASAQQMRQVLIDQVASPVRWEKGIRKMMESKIDIYVEMGPGKTLSGMNKRIGVAEPTYSIEKTADLQELNKLMESYATVES
ncbi:MAG: ACP S-malonyltransferase [Verrucomicrobia bacterium]|nr:ACP S-malonyltransferase [Verrucomicrobiota bacterium]